MLRGGASRRWALAWAPGVWAAGCETMPTLPSLWIDAGMMPKGPDQLVEMPLRELDLVRRAVRIEQPRAH